MDAWLHLKRCDDGTTTIVKQTPDPVLILLVFLGWPLSLFVPWQAVGGYVSLLAFVVLVASMALLGNRWCLRITPTGVWFDRRVCGFVIERRHFSLWLNVEAAWDWDGGDWVELAERQQLVELSAGRDATALVDIIDDALSRARQAGRPERHAYRDGAR